jgi:aconitate hydratase
MTFYIEPETLHWDGQSGVHHFYNIRKLAPIERLPFSMRIVLENIARHSVQISGADAILDQFRDWPVRTKDAIEVPFYPSRVLMQDFLGVAALVDLAAMRDVVAERGGDPQLVNPQVPIDLVIDHSIQVDRFRGPNSVSENLRLEFNRNSERYEFLKWCQSSFNNIRIVPPGNGIVHQLNLEHLSHVVSTREAPQGQRLVIPDTLVGTDSHTPMINGLGVLGWGVGGIEAEAAALGQPVTMPLPTVVGVRLVGNLPAGATATDLVLLVVQRLRRHGVVDKYVEFFGPSLGKLAVWDRATIANMAPEYGATVGYFPFDQRSVDYLALSGRTREQINRVAAYCEAQGLFHTDGSSTPVYNELVEIDLAEAHPCVAGPSRPQDRVRLSEVRSVVQSAVNSDSVRTADQNPALVPPSGPTELTNGSIVIAAITSCTNTSNPSVMIAAGLLARNAAERGLTAKPWVKTSIAPGSRTVSAYLERAGLLEALAAVGFEIVGYGCTTCIGNSGPLADEILETIRSNRLSVCAVLSGNRNFEARIHDEVRMNFLASPPLVIAYALVGHISIDLDAEPIGTDKDGKPVFLADIWPAQTEIDDAIRQYVTKEHFARSVHDLFEGDQHWKAIRVEEKPQYTWNPQSTYILRPSYVEAPPAAERSHLELHGARTLAVLGDSINTDYIAPAGPIDINSPAGLYLAERGIMPDNFNTYGSRRGNHEVSTRCTFANRRLKNMLVPGREGGFTVHHPSGDIISIYDAAIRYSQSKTPLIVIAGHEYGAGSSRDWAAKGPRMLGVQCVLAQSFERIHRSNLIGMGILPLQFAEGESAHSLGLTGAEVFNITVPLDGSDYTARVVAVSDQKTTTFNARVLVNTPQEARYVQADGILKYMVGEMLQSPLN